MSATLLAVLQRDLALAYRKRAEMLQPMMFFMLV
ncbi:MAG: ABC-type transport system involved in cytochrome c biogenesis permease component, partial [Paraglaciecola sp.]